MNELSESRLGGYSFHGSKSHTSIRSATLNRDRLNSEP